MQISIQGARCKALIALTTLFVVGFAAELRAFPPFLGEFVKMYVKAEDDASDEQKAFAKLITDKDEGLKCNVCHFGKNKRNRNVYGQAIDKKLDKEAVAKFKKMTGKDASDEDKAEASKMVQEVLAEVAKLPANPEDKDSPKFGELIEQFKAPGSLVETTEEAEEDK